MVCERISKLGGRERGLVKIGAVVLLNGVVDVVTKNCFFQKSVISIANPFSYYPSIYLSVTYFLKNVQRNHRKEAE